MKTMLISLEVAHFVPPHVAMCVVRFLHVVFTPSTLLNDTHEKQKGEGETQFQSIQYFRIKICRRSSARHRIPFPESYLKFVRPCAVEPTRGYRLAHCWPKCSVCLRPCAVEPAKGYRLAHCWPKCSVPARARRYLQAGTAAHIRRGIRYASGKVSCTTLRMQRRQHVFSERKERRNQISGFWTRCVS